MLILLLLWCLSGPASFIFWWTKDYNMRSIDFFLAFLCIILGPITYFIGYDIQGACRGRNFFGRPVKR